MKHSIRRQFALIFIGLMAATILLCVGINNLFLDKYYIKSKVAVIDSAYESIKEAANSDAYDMEEFVEKLNEVCTVSNLTVCIMDSNSKMKYVSANGGRALEEQLIGYIFGNAPEPTNIIEQDEEYILHQVETRDGEYLIMYGRFSTGISFIMRTPVESIRESSSIANRFFAYAGLIGTIIGGIIIWLVSSRMTKPIKELNTISEQMVHLNFEAKYTGKANNEIGKLGENMNTLSQSLEQSIIGLKTANNELQKDIEKKEQIDEMRREFLANVSHELKTPLALIQGYAEGLQIGINDDEESKEYYCEVIVDEAAKMNRLVQKLLTLNQLEFGNDIVNMERFNITALIKAMIQSSLILAKQSDIQLHMDEYDDIYVWGDQFKTEEVFSNYLSNAFHHCTNEKRIVITIKKVENRVRISVFNTGNPIPAEALDKVWDKFYKVDKARTREYGGNGIGLSIVKAIMESMSGKYGVENHQNGVLFWFEMETAMEEKAKQEENELL